MKAKIGDLIRTVDGEIYGYNSTYSGQLCLVRRLVPAGSPREKSLLVATEIATGREVKLYEEEFEVAGSGRDEEQLS